ncbi:MAG TPA: protein translocase subunit SecF, partial [Kofleriaceae bacterium]
FAFVRKFKIWLICSIILMAASIGMLFVNKQVRGDYMNWTIDFKGGTEIIYAFKDKQTGEYVAVDSAKVRQTFEKAKEEGIELSNIEYTESTPSGDKEVKGLIVRSPRFSAITPDQKDKATAGFMEKFKDREIHKAAWSGDRLHVRSQKAISDAEAVPVFTAQTLEVKSWTDKEREQYAHPDEGTGEYNQVFAMWGLDRQYAHLLDAELGNVQTIPVQSYGVGAKAGEKLRNDATKALVYAIFLIMLYLAFRFDVRYAPGAAFATIHDAVMVIGVFAVTWQEVSLVSVAGLLTVIGFSVNDTVVVFDRIRENQAKLKDKKIERIIDISINEMLVRTVLTSTTVFATTLIMNIFGTGVVKNFAFAMNVGVIVGVYSSIFLAAPVFLWISRKWYAGPPKRRRAAAASAEAAP